MSYTIVTHDKKVAFNESVTHPLQAYEWGEFRKKTGVDVFRFADIEKTTLKNGYQLTIHKIPYTPWTIGYLPKCTPISSNTIIELNTIGKEKKCLYIQLEPNIVQQTYTTQGERIQNTAEITKNRQQFERVLTDTPNLRKAHHPLFTQHTFVFDLTKSEENLLAAMHHKTRYNIRVAEKHNVEVVHDNSDEAFEIFQILTEETTGRQGFYAHSREYRKKMWETLRAANGKEHMADRNKLTAHLLIAKYHKPQPKADQPLAESAISYTPLVAWVLFVFKDTLYYPYGASSSQYREAMASTAMMWEAIKFGKKLGLKRFDMWGSLGPNPDPKDPWYGFHRFKQGFSPTLVEFVGSYDFVINPLQYKLFVMANKLRWAILKLKK